MNLLDEPETMEEFASQLFTASEVATLLSKLSQSDPPLEFTRTRVVELARKGRLPNIYFAKFALRRRPKEKGFYLFPVRQVAACLMGAPLRVSFDEPRVGRIVEAYRPDGAAPGWPPGRFLPELPR